MLPQRATALAASVGSRVSLRHLALAGMCILLALTLGQPRAPLGVDFHTYLAAARVGLGDGWGHIYDQARVATVERQLAPAEDAQPFLSPPPVAWLAVLVSPLPFLAAFGVWAGALLVGLVVALAWSARGPWAARSVLALAVVATSWVMLAAYVGQVVLLVAIAVVIAARLLREDRDLAAGLVLSLLILKPNTVILVPVALLVAGRLRAVATMALVGLAVLVTELLLSGPNGLLRYAAELTGPLPRGADALTLHGALGVGGAAAAAARVGIVAAAAVAARRLRGVPGSMLAAAVVGSLLLAPYLHTSDLSMLVVAGWLLWQDTSALPWKLALGAGWLLAAPVATVLRLWFPVGRWVLVELAVLVALLLAGRQSSPHPPLATGL